MSLTDNRISTTQHILASQKGDAFILICVGLSVFMFMLVASLQLILSNKAKNNFLITEEISSFVEREFNVWSSYLSAKAANTVAIDQEFCASSGGKRELCIRLSGPISPNQGGLVTIASLSDFKGTVTGGSYIGDAVFDIKGTGFSATTNVFFGTATENIAAKKITFISATKIQVTTPTFNGNQNFNLTVVNDGVRSAPKPYYSSGFTAKPDSPTTCTCWICPKTLPTGEGYNWTSDGERLATGVPKIGNGCPTNGGASLKYPFERNVCAKYLGRTDFTCHN